MWTLSTGRNATGGYELFGDDIVTITALGAYGYQVEVMHVRAGVENRYRLIRLDRGNATHPWEVSKVRLGEFGTAEELVAMAKLIVAGQTN